MITKIYIDFKSPASYLAIKPTVRLLDRHQLKVEWLPYQTKQESVPKWHSEESTGDSHRRVRAKARRDTHLMYAKAQGVSMRFPVECGGTDLALAALTYAKESPLAFLQVGFEAYWVDNMNLNDREVVSELLKKSGNNENLWDSAKSLAQLDVCQREAEEFGIVDAPAFVVDSQIFIGREHLPLIDSMLKK
jgi:2-hydroxychromene-2-carboxylate isomerase